MVQYKSLLPSLFLSYYNRGNSDDEKDRGCKHRNKHDIVFVSLHMKNGKKAHLLKLCWNYRLVNLQWEEFSATCCENQNDLLIIDDYIRKHKAHLMLLIIYAHNVFGHHLRIEFCIKERSIYYNIRHQFKNTMLGF